MSATVPEPVRNGGLSRCPPASSDLTRRRMQRQRRRDTEPEMVVRRLVHAAGLRYRVDVSPLPTARGRADLVFTKARVAVFIDGCFWHGCPQHGSTPKSNSAWWQEKIGRNRSRDAETDVRLERAGWTVIRAWEHEDALVVAERVINAVYEARKPESAKTKGPEA